MKIITKINEDRKTKVLCELSMDELSLILFGVTSKYSLQKEDERIGQIDALSKKLDNGYGNMEFPVFEKIARVIALSKDQNTIKNILQSVDRSKADLQSLLEYQEGLEYFLKFGSEPLDV